MRCSCQVPWRNGRLIITTTSPTSRTFLSARSPCRSGQPAHGTPHRSPWALAVERARGAGPGAPARGPAPGTSSGSPADADRDAGHQPGRRPGRRARPATRLLVEAGELVGVQPHRPRLEGEVGGGLAGVVLGVERLVATLALLVGRELGADDRTPPRRAAPSRELPRDRCRTRTVVARRCRARRPRTPPAGRCRSWAPTGRRAAAAGARRGAARGCRRRCSGSSASASARPGGPGALGCPLVTPMPPSLDTALRDHGRVSDPARSGARGT